MWNVRMGNTWLGAALIALGVAFFAGSYFGYELRNWWALFILIPAVGAFGGAWYAWQHGSSAGVASAPCDRPIVNCFGGMARVGYPTSRLVVAPK